MKPMSPLGHETRLPPFNCLICGYKMDCASGVENDARPRPGMISICLRCGDVAMFDETMRLRPLTPREWENVRKSKAWETIQKAKLAIRMIH